MASSSSSYKEEASRDAVEEFLASKPDVRKLWVDVDKSRDAWVSQTVSENMHSIGDDKSLTVGRLGDRYKLKDIFVSKEAESNVSVTTDKAEMHFRPIPDNERNKMRKKGYNAIHIDGIIVNCQPYVVSGSKGFVIVSIYDERYIIPSEGFLGLMCFNLGEKSREIKIKLDYCISTADVKNWVAVVSVFDHGLSGNMTPCNINFKVVYKYTNNIERFQKDKVATPKGSTFHVPIQTEDKVTVVEALRNALDYSSHTLLDRTFMKNLSQKEMQSLLNSRMNAMKDQMMNPTFRRTSSGGMRGLSRTGIILDKPRSSSFDADEARRLRIDFKKVDEDRTKAVPRSDESDVPDLVRRPRRRIVEVNDDNKSVKSSSSSKSRLEILKRQLAEEEEKVKKEEKLEEEQRRKAIDYFFDTAPVPNSLTQEVKGESKLPDVIYASNEGEAKFCYSPEK